MARARKSTESIVTPVGNIEVEANKQPGRPAPSVADKLKQPTSPVRTETFQIRNHKGDLIVKTFEVGTTGRSGFRRLVKVEKIRSKNKK